MQAGTLYECIRGRQSRAAHSLTGRDKCFEEAIPELQQARREAEPSAEPQAPPLRGPRLNEGPPPASPSASGNRLPAGLEALGEAAAALSAKDSGLFLAALTACRTAASKPRRPSVASAHLGDEQCAAHAPGRESLCSGQLLAGAGVIAPVESDGRQGEVRLTRPGFHFQNLAGAGFGLLQPAELAEQPGLGLRAGRLAGQIVTRLNGQFQSTRLYFALVGVHAGQQQPGHLRGPGRRGGAVRGRPCPRGLAEDGARIRAWL